MNATVSILTREETREILKATYATLQHALKQALKIENGVDPTKTMVTTIEQSLLSIEAALSPRSSSLSTKGHSANASARLRSALQRLKQMPVGSPAQSATERSFERILALLSPLTQDEGPYVIVPRKQLSTRRRARVSKESRRKRPRFDVSIGRSSETNFYTGFDKTIRKGGIFISTYNLYPKGTVINITATIPGDRCIVGSATVEWVREHNEAYPELPPGMGVTLNNLTQTASKEIDLYLTRHEPIFFEAI